MAALSVFEYFLVLLAAILASNVINRFLPFLSVPIIQIVLGALITLLPLGFHFELEPDLFFVLFIAPLVFNSGKDLDKKTFWSVKGPILNFAFLLVFVTVISVGYFVHFIIPAIPLAAAFALIASLGPTDDVAVDSVVKRLKMPPRIMNILVGESLLNDVSGIINFQFALAAAVSGTFSWIAAGRQFLILGLGGILIGLAFTLIKLLLVRWLRSLGMENVTFHILIELLTPFLVYIISEKCGTSGVLAVFTAGVAHSFGKNKLNPETANLNIASENIWSMVSFTLDGLVFLILGTQLPGILITIIGSPYSISTGRVILVILLITALFMLIRFLWTFFTLRKKAYNEPENPLGKLKASLFISLSGARGTVTLASILSIPYILSNGTPFPERDLLILISTGVILCTLIVTTFILPSLLKKRPRPKTAKEKG
ncbi:cation:proton antiporter [Leadbettera azotonutricia]|uniref:cation:proton antiporter n=1 Tax=Leadbettera azotonutricia TaxID=150829 RepID=UPI00030D5C02|nr:sodium:proton antiporter [Leadbettera azotonutricia]